MRTRRSVLFGIVCVCALAGGCSSSGVRGIEKYAVVQEGVLYRGAQPSAEGYERLRAQGIKTVIDLRHGERDEERQQVERLGMQYINIPSHADQPSGEDLARCLGLMLCPERQPVFVHCRQGRDRTGTAVAVYRMAKDGWDAERALKELRTHQGLNALFFPQIPAYLRELDAKTLASRAAALHPQNCCASGG